MGVLRSEPVVCPVDQHCSELARVYMGYCLCDATDWVSLVLGMISVLCWVVAEIPQIITNFRNKSSHGISILFLFTWILGDCFNLFGCILEPATLPTQYYTAVLYSLATFLLSSQSVYYGRIYPRLKANKRQEAVHAGAVERKTGQSNNVDTENVNHVERWEVSLTSPISVGSVSPDRSEEPFFMSARSLSVSYTAPVGGFLASRTPPSDIERNWIRQPLLGEARSTTQSAPPSKVKPMLCVVSLMTLVIGSCNRQLAESRQNASPTGGIVLRVGRRLFEAKASSPQGAAAAESSWIATYLGWGMAVIYMGGRLPQICLNIRRGNAEGLNPLMFVFAIVGNTTYVASILANSLQWLKLKPNLPWLVDAVGCVLLDVFILFQYFYYGYRSRRESEKYVS